MTDEKEDILFFMQQLRLDVRRDPKRKWLTTKNIIKELKRIENLINNNLD